MARSTCGDGVSSGMSDPASDLDADAVALLLTLMEAPEACISGAALQDFYSHAGRSLITAGALQADGYEPVATCMADHEDAPVLLTWRDEVDGHAYFSPFAGWVKVENERLARYRVDFPWVLTNVARQLCVLRTIDPRCLIRDHLWEVGPAWIGHRRMMTTVFVGRRLHQSDILDAAIPALRERANGRTGLLLITGNGLPGYVTLPGKPIVASISSCLAGASFSLDAGILASRLGGNVPARAEEPLEIIGGGRMVWFYGEKYEFPRGDKQRCAINYLYGQYQQGVYNVPTAQMIEDVKELTATTRIDKLFKDSPAWNRLLTQRNGMVSFCWPDEEVDGGGEEAAAAE